MPDGTFSNLGTAESVLSLNIHAYTIFVLVLVLCSVFWKEICLFLLFRRILYKWKYIPVKKSYCLSYQFLLTVLGWTWEAENIL